MKKLILTSAIMFTALCACNNSAPKNGDGEATDSISNDSTAINEQSEDHYAIWQMDSTNEVNFTTYDLAAFEVCGHVKTIKQGKCVTKFDKDGNITQYKDECSEFDLDHNDDGCLTIYACGAGSSTYSIDPETNKLVCYSGGEGGTSWTNWYKYDKNGILTQIECNYEDIEDGSVRNTEKVTILQSDAHNNWTKRKVGKNVESRTITYYPNAIGDEEAESASSATFNPNKGGCSFIGSIGGEEDCVLTLIDGEGYCALKIGQRLVAVDSYDASTGEFIIREYMKSTKEYIGNFKGTLKDGTYSGVFENTKGGKVNFKLVKSE